jgi:hypothetical protein
MPAVFERDGLRFQYPENWQAEENAWEEGWSVTLQSPRTTFMLVSVHADRPPVKELLSTALAAMREDYPDLEVTEAVEHIARQRAQGHDIQFFSLDLSNTCWLRSFRTPQKTVLILSQANDLELEDTEPVLRAIRASMEVADAE